MNQPEATKLIRDLFEQPFDEARFTRFVRELLNEVDESKAFDRPMTGQFIHLSYRDHVRQYRRIATYTDPDGQAVDILLVHLKNNSALERARTVQRNFVAHYLKTRGEKDAALVAYYGDDRADWRFSLVRMDYRLQVDGDSGKVKVQEDLTPARRFSFLVGEHEPNHTAQQQLFPILADDRNNPTLADLESAFNIESVTREFFTRYKELFLQVREELDGILARDRRVHEEFQTRSIDSDTFAKKLLGQIVFLYFLQKKGWLGVAQGQSWGSGSRAFLRRLFEKTSVVYDNFFNEVLEPLFYEALAVERADNFYGRLGCRIPFLNGGLFEPVGNYDWEGCHIPLSNATFGAIFDTFDLYNFTVREDEPLEKEVAVDPEMLGKVFENLLEVRDRKSKGAFYTPREIVHYMCQEALIHYLDTALNLHAQPLIDEPAEQGMLFGSPPPKQRSLPSAEMVYAARVPKEDIERFIRQGELAVEHETAREEGASSYKRRLPQSVAEHALALDDALAGVKVCDPAIGSGAFPVGVMQEIVRARRVLNAYLGDDASRTTYTFKRHAIQESIYGVDVDPGAVDIAKLRLWLSLVVDEEDYRSIKPLPNLGYKIVCGNSLLSVQKDLFNQHLFARVEELKEQYFVETDRARKQRQHQEIDALIGQLTSAQGQFDYEVYFSEVFRAQDGFDVVIGNPPYVRQELIKDWKPILRRHFGDVFDVRADIYVYFYARAVQLLRRSGVMAFITSNKWLRARYGQSLRRFLMTTGSPIVVIDFGELPVFETAATFPMILIFQKQHGQFPVRFVQIKSLAHPYPDIKQLVATQGTMLESRAMAKGDWVLTGSSSAKIVEMMDKNTIPLADYVSNQIYWGVKTGLNDAFIIDGNTRQRLIKDDPSSDEIIKRLAVGTQIRRWQIDFQDKWLIFTYHGIGIERYPAVKRFLAQYRDRLERRATSHSHAWYELQQPQMGIFPLFDKPKIVYPDIAKEPRFTFDTTGIYLSNTAYFIPMNDLYLLGILNSDAMWRYASTKLTAMGDVEKGGRLRFFQYFVQRLPIPVPNSKSRLRIESLVDRLLKSDGSERQVLDWEQELNALVYELYGLTADEIAMIETKFGTNI